MHVGGAFAGAPQATLPMGKRCCKEGLVGASKHHDSSTSLGFMLSSSYLTYKHFQCIAGCNFVEQVGWKALSMPKITMSCRGTPLFCSLFIGLSFTLHVFV